MTGTRSRTLVADFDSVQQAELVQRVGQTEAWWRMRAQLRTAHLLAEEIVLTDAQLLDGIYFLALGPAAIGEVLGLSADTPLPFVVVARGGELGTALDQMRTTSDFTWSSALAAAALRRAGGHLSLDLDDARERWVAAARHGLVRVEPFPAGGFPIADVLRELPPSAADIPETLTAELRTLVRRSPARAVIAAAGLAPQAEEAARRWWEEAYAAALARQHGATWLMFGRQDNQRVSQPVEERRSLPRRISDAVSRVRRRRRMAQQTAADALELDGTMLTTMATVPPGLYATIVYRSRDARSRWMERRDGGSLLSLALAVRLHTSPVESWVARYRATAVRTAVLFAAMLITLLSAIVPALSGWLVLPVLAALLGEVPYAELRSLLDERPGRLRGVIHLPAGGRAR